MKNNKKKIFLLISTYVTFIIFPKFNNNIKYNEEHEENSIFYFAEYNNKKIYIGNSEIIEKLKCNDNSSIYILDERNSNDPNVAIMNSCNIRDINVINNILRILIEYEKKYPSSWDRSFSSMKNEWIIHNICYDLNINRSSSETVDLNNNDEEKYLNIKKLILKR